MTTHNPDVIKDQLARIGFSLPEVSLELALEPAQPVKREEAVINVEKLLRLFIRSTHISDKLILVKLGARANAFTSDQLPELLRCEVFVEIGHRGGGQQRHFKLGLPLDTLNRALENCGGSFERFLELTRG